MKPRDIRKRGLYVARVSRKFIVVRVDNIREIWDGVNDKKDFRYDVTDMNTGRQMIFRSAAKFRREYEIFEDEKSEKIRRPRFDFKEGKIVFK